MQIFIGNKVKFPATFRRLVLHIIKAEFDENI